MLYTNTYPLFLRLMNNFRRDETMAQDLEQALGDVNPSFTESLFEQGSSVIRKIFENSKKYGYGSLVKSIEKIYTEGYKKILEYENFGQVILEEVYYKNYYYSFLINNAGQEKLIMLTNFYNEAEKNCENPLLTGTAMKPFTSQNKENWTNFGDSIVINTYNAFCSYGNYNAMSIDAKLNIPFFNDVIADLQMLPQNYENAVFHYTTFKNIIVVHNFDLVNWHRKVLSGMNMIAVEYPPFD